MWINSARMQYEGSTRITFVRPIYVLIVLVARFHFNLLFSGSFETGPSQVKPRWMYKISAPRTCRCHFFSRRCDQDQSFESFYMFKNHAHDMFFSKRWWLLFPPFSTSSLPPTLSRELAQATLLLPRGCAKWANLPIPRCQALKQEPLRRAMGHDAAKDLGEAKFRGSESEMMSLFLCYCSWSRFGAATSKQCLVTQFDLAWDRTRDHQLYGAASCGLRGIGSRAAAKPVVHLHVSFQDAWAIVPFVDLKRIRIRMILKVLVHMCWLNFAWGHPVIFMDGPEQLCQALRMIRLIRK